MNYSQSKNDITPVVNDTPAAYTSLKNNLAQRTAADTPFLLLPVRMETRFRRVTINPFEISLTEQTAATPVITKIKDLGGVIKTYTGYTGFDGATALNAAREITGILSGISSDVKNIEMIMPAMQEELKVHNAAIGAGSGALLQNFINADSTSEYYDALTAEASLWPEYTAAIASDVSDIAPDNSWMESVTDAARVQGEKITQLAQDTGYLVERITSSSDLDKDLPSFLAQAMKLPYFFNELDSPDTATLQYLWTNLTEWTSHFERVQDVVTDRLSENVNDYRNAAVNYYKTAFKLQDIWSDKMLQGTMRTSVLVPMPDADNLDGEIAANLPENIWQLINGIKAINTQQADIVATIKADSVKLEGWALQQYVENNQVILNMLEQLADICADENDDGLAVITRLTWNALKDADKFFGDLKIHLTTGITEEAEDYLAQGLDNLHGSIIDVGINWNKVSGTGVVGSAKVFGVMQDVDQLWVRVYPDDIAIHAHEEALTQVEKDAGIAYWTEWWAAHGDVDKQLAAWRALVGLFGPQRAAWIVKVLTPVNLANAVVISNVFQVLNQVGTLNTYTAQLAVVAQDPAQMAALPGLVGFYNPQLQKMVNSLSDTGAVTRDYAAKLVKDIRTANDNFVALGQDLVSRSNEFSGMVNEITVSFSGLLNTAHNIHVIGSWDEIYNETPVYPNVTIKDAGWSEPSKSYVLPDRFLFAALNDTPNNSDLTESTVSFSHIRIGNRVPADLHVSVDPLSNAFNDTAVNNLLIDPAIKWMIDFEEAVTKGMGVKITLTATEAQKGFDKVLALGTRLNESVFTAPAGYSSLEDYTRKNGKALLEQLLNNHHYAPDGLSFVPVGTPTNNTDAQSAGYNDPDPYAQTSFETEIKTPLFSYSNNILTKADGQWMADALGIDYSVLQHIRYAGKKQISNAIAMNRALWPATAGSFMTDMMNRLFTKHNIDQTKAYFTDNVLARGPLPSIRVGNQPYGILPATAFGRWQHERTFQADPNIYNGYGLGTIDPSQKSFGEYKDIAGFDADKYFADRYRSRLYNVLKCMNSAWLRLAKWKVKTVDKNSGTANAQKDFMEMLGTDATMAEAYTRFLLNDLIVGNAAKISDTQDFSYSAVNWANVRPQLADLPDKFFSLFKKFEYAIDPAAMLGSQFGVWDDKDFANASHSLAATTLLRAMQILNVQLFTEQYQLLGPTVDEKKLSETDTLTPISGSNYIQYLLSAGLNDLWHNNDFGSMQSRSLLFLLLRQSTLLTYRETALDTLVRSGVFKESTRHILGSTEGIVAQISNDQDQLQDQMVITKWHLLFNSLGTLRTNTAYQRAIQYFSAWDNNTNPNVINLSQSVPGWQNVSLADYLKNPQAYSSNTTLNNNTSWTDIDNLRNALDTMKALSTAELDRLMKEHIDLMTYRLDAWNYGMVNKRLWYNRKIAQTRKTGIYLGAYGWLLDVRPKNAAGLIPVLPQHIPSHLNEGATVYYDPKNLGFIHTPSIAHALTAAILRSGYVSEKNASDNRFAVNLTADRVHLAMSILEGVRGGQAIEALLGYQFERGLHEHHSGLQLDMYIAPLRRAFPLADTVSGTGAATESIRPANVVHGINMLHAFKAVIQPYLDAYPDQSIYDLYTNTALTVNGAPMYTLYPFGMQVSGTSLLPANLSNECKAVIQEIDRMANAIDAIGDLAVAEGVFQIARGNASRSAAVMEALTEGKNPPEPEIINTPHTGTHISHRVVAMIDPAASVVSPWDNSLGAAIAATSRATAEPALNKWVADMLSAMFPAIPSRQLACNIACLVSFNDQGDNGQAEEVLLGDLGLQPLDLVYLLATDDYKEELSKRISYYVRRTTNKYFVPIATGMPEAVQVKVNYQSKGTKSISFADLLTSLMAIQRLLKGSRWLKAEDFTQDPNPVVNAGAPLFDLAELQGRAGVLIAALNTEKTYFNGLGTINNDILLGDLRAHLLNAAALGVDFAHPYSSWEKYANADQAVVDEIVERMTESAKKTATELSTRHKNATDLITPTALNGLSEEELVRKYLEVIAIALGNEFKAVPKFSFGHYQNLQSSLTDQLSVNVNNAYDLLRFHLPNEQDMLDDWIFGLARVKEKIDDVETLRMLVTQPGVHTLKNIRPVQFPYVAADPNAPIPVVDYDYWLGAEYPAGYRPSGDKLSVAVFNYTLLSASGTSFAGIVIDEWNELIPAEQEMSGITFHYDQPNARPPQSLLLAVCPALSGSWKVEDLLYTLLDTLEMTKMRLVEPDHFKMVAWNDTPADSTGETRVFEVFKWMLPAVVGEVTPHKFTGTAPNRQHAGYQGSESIQQVSFEYNPNNGNPPTPVITNGGSGGPVNTTPGSGTLNWQDINTDAVIADQGLQSFINTQNALTNASVLQNQLNAGTA